jgi:hypothetical protein
MMKAKEIVKILEGFKLGKLGAGTKAAGQRPPSALVHRRNVNGRLDVIFRTEPNDNHPYVKWQDTDGIVYILACDQVSEKKWKVFLYSQKSRKITDPLTDQLWELSTDEMTEKQARKLYVKGFGMILPAGIYAMLKTGYLHSFFVTRSQDGYEKWLDVKSQELANE